MGVCEEGLPGLPDEENRMKKSLSLTNPNNIIRGLFINIYLLFTVRSVTVLFSFYRNSSTELKQL